MVRYFFIATLFCVFYLHSYAGDVIFSNASTQPSLQHEFFSQKPGGQENHKNFNGGGQSKRRVDNASHKQKSDQTVACGGHGFLYGDQMVDRKKTLSDLDVYKDSGRKNKLTYLLTNYPIGSDWQGKISLSQNTPRMNDFIRSVSQTRQQAWALKNKITYKQFLSFGFDSDYNHYRLESAKRNNRANSFSKAAYLSAVFPLTSTVTLSAEETYAKQFVNAWPNPDLHLTKNDHVTVSNVGLIWKPNTVVDIYLRRDGNYRFSKAGEQVWVTDVDKKLQTEQGVSYEVGIDWHPEKKELKLALYRLDLRNEIAFDQTNVNANLPFGKMSNLPPTERLGVNVLGWVQLNQAWSTKVQASLLKSQITSGEFSGKQVPSISPFNTSATVSYYGVMGWLISLTEVYNGAYFDAEDLANINSKLPPYFVTNVNFSKHWSSMTMGLRLNNLFNKKYPRYAYFVDATRLNPGQVSYYPQSGFNVLATWKLYL